MALRRFGAAKSTKMARRTRRRILDQVAARRALILEPEVSFERGIGDSRATVAKEPRD